MACSLGERRGQWEPAWIFTRIPLVQNVIEQRFMAFGYLAAAVLLAVIMERTYRAVPDWRGALGALAVSGVALVPTAVIFSERLPFAMQAVVLPRWYSEVAPTLPPGRVLLTYPAPFSGIQSSMAWQSVLGMPFSLAGGGGPQGVERRAGTAAPGFGCCPTSVSGGRCLRPPAPRPNWPRSATPCRSGRSTPWWSRLIAPSRRGSWGGTPSMRRPS